MYREQIERDEKKIDGETVTGTEVSLQARSKTNALQLHWHRSRNEDKIEEKKRRPIPDTSAVSDRCNDKAVRDLRPERSRHGMIL